MLKSLGIAKHCDGKKMRRNVQWSKELSLTHDQRYWVLCSGSWREEPVVLQLHFGARRHLLRLWMWDQSYRLFAYPEIRQEYVCLQMHQHGEFNFLLKGCLFSHFLCLPRKMFENNTRLEMQHYQVLWFALKTNSVLKLKTALVVVSQSLNTG